MLLFDVVTVGDAVVDLFISLPPEGNHYHIDSQNNELDLMLGEKIGVATSNFSLGGNATHVAIGLSRIGFKTALTAELGTDEFSEKILKDLEKERVGKNLLHQTPGAPSTFSVIISAGNDRTILSHHVTRSHNFSFSDVMTNVVYLTSLGEKWENAYAITLAFVKQSGAKLVLNPGSLQVKAGAKALDEYIRACDVFIVNKQEAEEILYGEVLSKEKEESIESLLFRLQRMGTNIAVITDGENGAYAIDKDATVYMQKAFKVTVTEKTGAGDAFATGFLAGRMSGKSIQECLLWGSADAAGVVSKHGGQEGLLTKKQLLATIRENT